MAAAAPEEKDLARRGVAALQAGDYAAGRSIFEALSAARADDPETLLLLAYACRGGGDHAAEERAVDRALARQPSHLRALVAKGDCRQTDGDLRAASRWYRAALAGAEPAGSLPRNVGDALTRARLALASNSAAFARHLEDRLTVSGFPPPARSKLFQISIEMLSGSKEADMGRQRPTSYFFPGLPQKNFYERSEFDWAASVEAASDAIREELGAIADNEALFRPYLTSDPERPQRNLHGLLDNPAWSTLYLTENGNPVAPLASRAPATMAALASVPLCQVAGRAPSILFSRLGPGARIPPHTGMLNARLICHLPLVIPPACAFRVGEEVRAWEPGKLLIFDDSVEHEAWNDSEAARTVLIFDVWRPELEERDQAAIAVLFEAIDSFAPQKA